MNEKKKIGEVTKTLRYGQQIQSNKVKKIVNTPTYTTNGEYLLIVKDVDKCEITLDGSTTESIKIKVLTKTTIIPMNSLIDEQYEEVEIDNGACIELEYYLGGWYIISSDGMKLD
jgi:hypothetical protein